MSGRGLCGAVLGVGAAVALGWTRAGRPEPPGLPVPASPSVASPVPRAQDGSVPYDGRFVFTRVRFGSGGRGFRGFGGADWAHDYPDADLNMGTVLAEVTAVRPVTGRSAVVDLEDPAVFLHPLLYLSEPGFWRVSEVGARNLRAHLLKGGFILFDDFDGPGHWENFERQIRRVLPEFTFVEIDAGHPVFQAFFRVEDIYVPHPNSQRPTYLGLFEDNDPRRRMLALVNYNADLAEYWEWSATGFLPIDPTNDAYRLGVNYIVYGLTH